MTKTPAEFKMLFRNSSLGRVVRCVVGVACIFIVAAKAEGQIQVDLKFKRLQYIAYEPIVATLSITNLAGRDIDLHNADGQSWLGFEITGNEGEPVAPMSAESGQPPLKVGAGQRVTHQINLTPLYPVHDFGTYHVRTNVYFADLGKFFYSPTRVFEVTDTRPIWQQTVGIPDGVAAPGNVRTYSLLTNRFPDHTSLYVRVQDKDSGIVYATYSLGRAIAFEEPQAEIDHANQLHVLHCSAPRAWAYSRVGLNGELLAHSSFMETKTRPRLVRAANGDVAVRGGMLESPAAQSSRGTAPKLSARPPELPKDD
ncbi:MAG TPA: hypothetical protein VFA61_03760 [Candidatus Udaeobacter sp.]|nr:hypothetical protein [Candidatus Udaeobacter sp.]